MEAGIPVINVDREFSSPFAARATILGDNYGMGVSAGTYACQLKEDKNLTNPVIAEIAGIDALPLTQDRSKGFADALKACGEKVDNRVAAEFTVESGEEQASNLLQAAPKIDIIWNHDDDQGVGVKAAFDNANRDEFAFIGGAGSCNAMGWIEDGEMEATVHLPADPGRGRHQAGPADRAGQGDVRPGPGRGAEARSSSTRRWSPRTTSRSTCPSASSPDLTLHGPAEGNSDDRQSSPTLGVGMVGYAFMGAVHSQAWRTAGRFFDLPLAPAMTALVRS